MPTNMPPVTQQRPIGVRHKSGSSLLSPNSHLFISFCGGSYTVWCTGWRVGQGSQHAADHETVVTSQPDNACCRQIVSRSTCPTALHHCAMANVQWIQADRPRGSYQAPHPQPTPRLWQLAALPASSPSQRSPAAHTTSVAKSRSSSVSISCRLRVSSTTVPGGVWGGPCRGRVAGEGAVE